MNRGRKWNIIKKNILRENLSFSWGDKMETFAGYILGEKELIRKMEIVYYLKKRTGIFYDNSVILKAEIAKLFIETMKLPVDENLVLTACLLYGCKKTDGPQDLTKIRSYAKEGAEYLRSLGFSKRFCKICEEHNRYSGSQPREKESDILEIIDQFGRNAYEPSGKNCI